MFTSSSEIVKSLSKKEKIRLFNGKGSWETFDAGGKIPAFWMSDGPHGLRKQDAENYSDLNNSHLATCFPTASCIASSWSRESLALLGKAISDEAVNDSVDLVLGPGINIKRSPLCGRNFEYFSEDPYLAGSLAAEYVKGLQQNGRGSCVKHYACNNQEKRRQTSNSIVDEKTLFEIYLRAFEIVIKKANPHALMVSYNKVNGEYAAKSSFLLTELLRNKWQYKGAVISDWGACMGANDCLKAGMTLAMPDSCGYFDSQLHEKYDSDQELREKLDEANSLIIDLAKNYREWDKKKTYGKLDFTEQHAIALKLACDSAVLLKNDSILPLKEEELYVIGQMAKEMKFQGGGSSHINSAVYPNALESLKNCGYKVNYAQGYNSDLYKKEENDQELEKEAVALITEAVQKDCPVLFFCGLSEEFEGEGFDRSSLSLPENQLALLERTLNLGAKVIIVSFSGAPVDFYFADRVKAILHMYLCGEACGEACASLLSGKTNPSGKLAESFPYRIEDTPCYGNFAHEGDNIEYKEGCLVGYRHYRAKNIPVRYEFGFGLSYTSFEYSDLKINQPSPGKITLSFELTNTGDVDGSEISQVYVCTDIPQLRGFAKTSLKAKESKTVCIELDDNSFKEYDSSLHDFVAREGSYKIQVGKSVNNIVLEKEISLSKEAADFINNEANSSYIPSITLYEKFFNNLYVEEVHKGTFTSQNSLGDMAKESRFVRIFLKILTRGLLFSMKGKSKEDPSVKIAISAIKENPLESLISTSGGLISTKLVNWILRRANA